MLKMVLMSEKGPLLFCALQEENLTRLRAGMPIEVDLKAFTPPGTRLTTLVISVHESLGELLEEMRAGGVPITDEQIKEARAIDESR